MVAQFYNLFNEALANYKGEKGYKFNLSMICCNEAGANLQAICEVYGEDFYNNKVATCYWHFFRCVECQLNRIDVNERKMFMDAVHALCKASTVMEYKRLSALLEGICKRSKIMSWWNWWKVRRIHLVPALCQFGWTGTNWAEIGHASMKTKRQLWLSYATYIDVCHMIMQDNEYVSFLKNKGKTVGRGPSTVRMQRKEIEAEDRFMEQALDALESGDIREQALQLESTDGQFIPSATAKHKAPKTFSTKNPLQKHTAKATNAKSKNVRFEQNTDTDNKGNKDRRETEETESIPEKSIDSPEQMIQEEEEGEDDEAVEQVEKSSVIKPSKSNTKKLP